MPSIVKVSKNSALKSQILRPCLVLVPVFLVAIAVFLTQAPTGEPGAIDSNDYVYRIERSVVPAAYPLKAVKVTKETYGRLRGEVRYDLILIDNTTTLASLEGTPELTIESWHYLLGQLSPDGVISYTLPEGHNSEANIYRLISLGLGSLLRAGVKEPRNNLIVVKNEKTATIIVGLRPFSDEFLMTTEMLNVERGLQVVISPLVEESLSLSWLISPQTHPSFVTDYAYDVTAPDYNRPFFFWIYKFSGFSAIIVLGALGAPVLFYRVLSGGKTRGALDSYEYILLYLTTVTILNAILLLRLQSYVSLSGVSLAFGVFGLQVVATVAWLLIGAKSSIRGSRFFFGFGATVGFLMVCITLTGILPLLVATNDLPIPARGAIVSGVLLILTVSTTWPVLGLGNTSPGISARQIAIMASVLSMSIVGGLMIARLMGISEALVAMGIVMAVHISQARMIRDSEVQLATEGAPTPSRLVVEEFHEPTPCHDASLDRSIGIPIGVHSDGNSSKVPEVLV